MTYISLDPGKLQTLIDNLRTFQDQVYRSVETVYDDNRPHDYPLSLDLGTFYEWSDIDRCDLVEEIEDLQARLDSAKAANESGVAFADPDGTMYYYIPDDAQDTADNATTYNNVATVNQARADLTTLMNYSDDCSSEEWDALLTRLQEHQDDPAYANTILANIGPGRLLDLPADVQIALLNPSYGASTSQVGNIETDRPNAGHDLCGVLSHILAAASRTWTDERATAYADRLVHSAEEEGRVNRIGSLNGILSTSRAVDIDSDGTDEAIGLDYNDALLYTIASGFEVDEPTNKDVLLGVVHAMTGNPGAAERWLSVDGSADAEKTASRTRYIISAWGSIGENQWTDDWSLLSAQEAILGTSGDSGDGTTQAAIVSGTLNAIGEGGAISDDEKAATKDIRLSDAARNTTSIALSCYPYGFQQSAVSGNPASATVSVEGDTWGAGMPDQPTLTNKALVNITGQIGQNDTAVTRLAASQEAFNKVQTAGDSAHQGDGSESFTDDLEDQSSTRGFVAGAIARQSEIDGADADARVGAWTNAASIAISAIPMPQVKAGSTFIKIATAFLENAGKGAAAKGAETGITNFAQHQSAAQEHSSEVRQAGITSNTVVATLAVLNAGVYTQEELSKIRTHNEGVSLKPILSEDGTLLIDPGTDITSLDPQQWNALNHLSGILPSDGKHHALQGFEDNITNSYLNAYDDAHD